MKLMRKLEEKDVSELKQQTNKINLRADISPSNIFVFKILNMDLL